MNRESNSYTVIYAIIMVVLVAVGLAFTAQVLKSRQDKNVQIDKMQQILGSVGTHEKDMAKVEGLYKSIIKQELLVMPDGSIKETFEGDKIADNEAFEMNTANQFKEVASGKDLPLPVYVAEVDGQKKYIFPMNGAGLWGPIWGYIAVDADGDTVFGTNFSHQGETPGLGAEIATAKFENQFKNKKLFVNGQFESVAVVKAGRQPSIPGQSYVDGISGGTLTSNGVNNMLLSSLKPYVKFLDSLKASVSSDVKAEEPAVAEAAQDMTQQDSTTIDK
ncbi:NADH:ubiquinone reductase (Na(+)-transporting) subunit C [Falsiporphyromonas endometrii]|uniref:Na(+)-translocating NADH-quinone reductase subunit C n=1 Tax=Falsiporphyromonas endometrii TaxID=1387297 RepID=A0ABV9KB65_9PORP